MRNLLACVVVCLLAFSAVAATPQYLEQNWSDDDRQWFYTTPQGSKLIPYAWAFALQRAGGDAPWIENLERFGFLANARAAHNPQGLPVGVVRDDDHLGLTCAACHTGSVAYRGTTWQIDGGPTYASLWDFLEDLGNAVNATARSGVNGERFRAFAAKVLRDGDTAANRAKLYKQLSDYNNYFVSFIAASRPNTAWGKARTDAFGMIFNRVTAIDLKIPTNSAKPDAPVSYPFLWDTGWHNKVQWNGVAPNQFAVERLARNVGEVLGVFAEIDLKKPSGIYPYYESTAKRLNLLEIEDRLADLRSPKWPAGLPAIDATKAARGQAIYNQQCVSCHAIATPGRHQNIVLTPLSQIGTDPQMATVSSARKAQTGVLQGVKSYLLFGPPLGPMAPAGTITLNATVGAIISPKSLQPPPAMGSAEPDRNDPDRDRLRQQLLAAGKADLGSLLFELNTSLKSLGAKHSTLDATDADLVYKARPLDGIWATAPYLHNGSVPTLWDLLMPVAQRPRTFHVGSRELDPVKVGFDSNPSPGSFLFDTSVKGNSNAGHTMGTNLSDEDRNALVEYLKSL